MIHATGSVQQARRDVFGLEIRKLFEDLLAGFAGHEQFQDIDHANPHAANTRPAAALVRADRDPLQKVG